jgi:hypothetical protein
MSLLHRVLLASRIRELTLRQGHVHW